MKVILNETKLPLPSKDSDKEYSDVKLHHICEICGSEAWLTRKRDSLKAGTTHQECILLRSSRHGLVGIVGVSRERHGTKFV